MYTISFDAGDRILHIRTWGFWDVATITAFTEEVLAIGRAARLRHGAFAVLTDMRAAPIQSLDVTAGVELLVDRAVRITTGPIASVAGSMLGKLQSERVLTPPNFRTFLDMDEARTWIRSERAAGNKK